MATINVLDSAGATVAIEKPLVPGRAAAALSRPVALSTEDAALLDGIETNQASQITQETAINTALGVKTDAKSTATDGTSISAISIWKQISASVQTIAAAGVASAVTMIDGASVTFGAKADAKASTSDATPITAMSIWKQISFSIQALVTAFGAALTRGSGAVDSNTQRVAIASDSAGVIATGTQAAPSAAYLSTVAAGDVAHDGVDSGNPQKIGGIARSTEPAAVASADRVNAIFDLVGKQIILPYANPENFVSGAITSAMTGTTTTSLIASPGGSLRNYITQITVSNAHATVGTDVVIQDGSGGTTLYTIPAAAVYGGAVITFPTPLRQPTTATAIFCANVTTGASTKVSASGYKGL